MNAVRILLATLCGHVLSAPVFAQVPDPSRGRALYENHCVVCHTSRVHARVNRIAISRAEVREIAEKWQAQEKLGWSAQEIDDVVEFLIRTRYQYP